MFIPNSIQLSSYAVHNTVFLDTINFTHWYLGLAAFIKIAWHYLLSHFLPDSLRKPPTPAWCSGNLLILLCCAFVCYLSVCGVREKHKVKILFFPVILFFTSEHKPLNFLLLTCPKQTCYFSLMHFRGIMDVDLSEHIAHGRRSETKQSRKNP